MSKQNEEKTFSIETLKNDWAHYDLETKYRCLQNAIGNRDEETVKFIIQYHTSDFSWEDSFYDNRQLVLEHTNFIFKQLLIERDRIITFLDRCGYRFDKFLFKFKDCLFFKLLDKDVGIALAQFWKLTDDRFKHETPLITSDLSLHEGKEA